MSCEQSGWFQALIVITLHCYVVRSTIDYPGVCRNGPGLVRHPARCDAFIECTDNGHAVERLCGPTLYFNEQKAVCDYQHLVTCPQLNNVATKYDETNRAPPTSTGTQSYQETVYGLQETSNDEYKAPASPHVSELEAYCHEAMNEAKTSTHQRLLQESSLSGQQQTASSPYSFVSNFLHTQPYAKTLTYSAMSCASAVKLIQSRYDMSGGQVLKMLNEMQGSLLKPLPGQYRPDSELPVAPDYDYCPYPANIVCYQDSEYRTQDGSCNNVNNALFGREMTPFRRLLPANYADGIGSIRQSVNGRPLPSARTVSFYLFTDVDRTQYSQTTMALVFYAQFVDHDLTRTAAYKVPSTERGGQMNEVQCGDDGCAGGSSDDPLEPCLPIAVPDQDYDFASNRCLKFVRSMPVPLLNCHVGQREQLNQVTHWLDGSQVYGSSKKESDAIRDQSQPDRGRMATIQNPNVYSKPLLPSNAEAAVCNGKNETIQCFKAGDGRVNENVGIMTYHTVFVRQHNLLEEGLHHFNPSWSGDKLYQETRRIVGAMLQHVTYNELLPLVVGPQAVTDYQLGLLTDGYFKGYDASIDARIPNEFAAAAFRFGHTLLQERLLRINNQGSADDSLWLSQTFNSPVFMYGSGPDVFIRGLPREQSQAFDWFFTKQITRSLFTARPPNGVGHDLTSINIQRGRDHGIATYNDFREWCGLHRARTFEDLASEIDSDFITEISHVYSDVNDIDLFAGGVSERPVKDGIVGPTFACIIASTFRNLRLGDRYWYENQQAGFTPGQLQELRKTRLARVLCLNSDSVSEIQPYVFLPPSAPPAYAGSEAVNQFNSPVPCDSLPDINLSLWTEPAY